MSINSWIFTSGIKLSAPDDIQADIQKDPPGRSNRLSAGHLNDLSMSKLSRDDDRKAGFFVKTPA